MPSSADQGTGGPSIFQNPGLEIARQIAADLSAADITPNPYRGNIGNCLLALDIATRDGLSVLEVMRGLHVPSDASGAEPVGEQVPAPASENSQPASGEKPKRTYRKRNGGGTTAETVTTQQQTEQTPLPVADAPTPPPPVPPGLPAASAAPGAKDGSERQPGDMF